MQDENIKSTVIWKYFLPSPIMVEVIQLETPLNAYILTVQMQYDGAYLWAHVDPNAAKEIREFIFFGTGIKIQLKSKNLSYIGTVQLYSGDLILHLFEKLYRESE